ncbi:MAG: UDP-N-acetylmuramoyl-tripeptide--D-alanyl-D-alanine ligase [Acetobacter sp.]|nr:UDP-N-acetylmuramoyl-tripeptide--D-alanyl-D-alanine ligase [Acetobacter sp.]
MIALSAEKIAEILGYNREVVAAEIREVSTDSRKVDEHTLFIAIKGEKFDGHDFILEVLAKGAPLVVSEHLVQGADERRVIVVEDTLKAFGKLAQYNRRQYKGTLIALTGSSGKTTTKEELKAALSAYAPTYATSGNFNNHIGVPRSLLDLDMNAKYAVIEMGMSARGEIEYLASLAEPDVTLVTNVYPMHIEFLGSLENIALAKAEIFSGLRKGGVAIYNADTAYAEILRDEAQKYAAQVFDYGRTEHPAVELHLQDDAEHYYYNAWAVLKVVEVLGLPLEKAVTVVNEFGALDGRGKKHFLNLRGRKVVLIDDSYSGQPDAMKLAIKALGGIAVSGRKIALLGKMAELGKYSKQAHIEVGQELAANKVDVVIGVCEETKDMLAELPAEVLQYYFPSVDGVAELLNDILKDGDVLLIKGAHYSSQVFKVAAELIKQGEKTT